ncbi:GNAT domain-containing protein [Xylariaceae sp. FL0255]|nr:GNAT domain-containing protein [Xylariaceae sp. FL0255]
MLINKDIAISTPKILLVPYDAHHVERYHQWMEDPDVQAATASEPLTLEEERENQQSWRDSHDKLTFIVCEPWPISTDNANDPAIVYAGEVDTAVEMLGDVNLFLTPYDEDNEDEEEKQSIAGGTSTNKSPVVWLKAEIDIMIASAKDRGKGRGKAAVEALLEFLRRNLDGILEEYHHTNTKKDTKSEEGSPRLRHLFAKMNTENRGSTALFHSLGFVPTPGGPDYFGELTVMRWPAFSEKDGEGIEGYQEVLFDRSRLGRYGKIS